MQLGISGAEGGGGKGALPLSAGPSCIRDPAPGTQQEPPLNPARERLGLSAILLQGLGGSGLALEVPLLAQGPSLSGLHYTTR